MTSLPQVGAGERFGDIIRSCLEIGPVIYLWNLWTCSHIRDSLNFACRAHQPLKYQSSSDRVGCCD